ncbi:MAG: DUF4422 domain-containing protein [Lachnospiraceae bacterium]|nr:DUF4422 domain-containing protein [Lachnospiraceae bacterium]
MQRHFNMEEACSSTEHYMVNWRENRKMKLFVISHKDFRMPVKDGIYTALAVGGDIPMKVQHVSDNTGDNISAKNWKYNELTGMYWIWKNIEDDIVGICHYRRYCVTLLGKILNVLRGAHGHFLTEKQIRKYLTRYDMIVHNKTYFAKNNKTQFCEQQKAEYYEAARAVIKEYYPEYAKDFETVSKQKYAHLLNMLIARKEVFDSYCEWLFPLLFRIEKYLEEHYPNVDMNRSMGMIGERLLDVWVLHNGMKYKECFSVNMERVDWKMW